MRNSGCIVLCLLLILHLNNLIMAQSDSDANIVGHVIANGEHLPFANIYIEGTNYGTTTDITGHYQMVNLPEGEFTIVASMIGYTPVKRTVLLKSGTTTEVKFELTEELIFVDEVVITGTKTFKRQTESAVIVNVLDAKTIRSVAAKTVSESLSFQPGLRMEIDCQTCNYSQLRINGLGGAYSQILINSRPVFSPLTGLYGLEQIPAEMVERIEVVRGGGSALYGSSAIGGTVNIITKLPQRNSFEITANSSVIGGTTPDNQLNGSVNVVSQKRNSGLSLFATYRKRDSYDHNSDGFSELPVLLNNSFGFNSFFLVKENHKLEANFSSLHEYRRGGDLPDEPGYLASQSEERNHYVLMGGLDYSFSSASNKTTGSIYLAGQYTTRNHFTGIQPDALQDILQYRENPPYGKTKNYTIHTGGQVNFLLNNFISGNNLITIGAEFNADNVDDHIKAYNFLIDQNAVNTGIFAQSDWVLTSKWTFLAGIRADKHNMVKNLIVNPRLSLLARPLMNTQIRLSWSEGFRAPQAFDADMHIAFAGGGIQKIVLAPGLKEEKSESWSISLNYDKPAEKYIFGFTLEGFYTRLKNAFILEELQEDSRGNSILQKRNGDEAEVIGTTLELRANFNSRINIETGLTQQKSKNKIPVQWSVNVPGVKEFLRTPETYGYYTLSWTPEGQFKASVSGIYTGPMLVPHFGVKGNQGTPENDLLFKSSSFLENNLKLSYGFKFERIDSEVEFFGGINNLFNRYQNDFDSGKYRDSNYIYGPSRPRTVFCGIRIFN